MTPNWPKLCVYYSITVSYSQFKSVVTGTCNKKSKLCCMILVMVLYSMISSIHQWITEHDYWAQAQEPRRSGGP